MLGNARRAELFSAKSGIFAEDICIGHDVVYDTGKRSMQHGIDCKPRCRAYATTSDQR